MESKRGTVIDTAALLIALIALSIVIYLLLKRDIQYDTPRYATLVDEVGGIFPECPDGSLCQENIDYFYSSDQPSSYGQPFTMNDNTGGRLWFTDHNCDPGLIQSDIYGGYGCHAHDGDPLSRYCNGVGEPPCPLQADDVNNCDACPAPGICPVSETNPQTFNYDPQCITDGGGVGCFWQNKAGCRLCWRDDDPNKPPDTPYLRCVQNPSNIPPPPQCESNSDCNGGFSCISGMCVASTCSQPSDCGEASVWNCISGNCRRKCCQFNSDCPDTGAHCQDKVCRLDTQPVVTVTFLNQSDVTLLIGANGPSPVLPTNPIDSLNPWTLAPGGSLTVTVPDDWKQTSQAAQCNASVSGPRFWARTGCNVGEPYWAEVLPRIDIEPPIALALEDPVEGESTVGNGTDRGTFKLGTKWVNTVSGAIFYKSYGDKWIRTYTVFTSGDSVPSIIEGGLGDIYRRNQYVDSQGRLQDYSYYMKTRKAQCDTGDCANQYDCSYANAAGEAGTSLAEFCFVCGDLLTYYDVSLVDGYNLSIDIKPIGGTPNPNDPFSDVTRLCEPSIDLRSEGAIFENQPASKFFLRAKDTPSALVGAGADPNRILSVFSNCGYYEYPVAPAGNCDPNTDEKCRLWRQFCCQSNLYGQPCKADSDCDNGGACWNGVCNCRSYYTCQNPGPPPPSTPIDDLNSVPNPDGGPRLWKEELVCCPPETCFHSRDSAAQPIQGFCDRSKGECIGDDLIHKYCHKAYSWPNDPTTFNSNAKDFVVTFSPNGTNYTNTRNVSTIPLCSSLDREFYYDANTAKANCLPSVANLYTCAVKRAISDPSPPPWACTVNAPGASCQGVGTLCRWQ